VPARDEVHRAAAGGVHPRISIVAPDALIALYSNSRVARDRIDPGASLGPIVSLPAGDARRARFDRLHSLTTLMTVNMGLGLSYLLVCSRELLRAVLPMAHPSH
jgi:hypothetical protein